MLVASHLHVEMARLDNLRACLPERPVRIVQPWEDSSDPDIWIGKKDAHHPLGQWTTATTVERPAVIYDDGASTCSPVITIDRQGNAFHFHEAFGLYLNREQLYYRALPEIVGTDEVVAAITGTNKDLTSEGEALPNYIDTIVDEVEAGICQIRPQATFLALISKRYATQQRVHPLVGPEVRPSGFTFIPRQIATDGLNHLLILPRWPDDIRAFVDSLGRLV